MKQCFRSTERSYLELEKQTSSFFITRVVLQTFFVLKCIYLRVHLAIYCPCSKYIPHILYLRITVGHRLSATTWDAKITPAGDFLPDNIMSRDSDYTTSSGLK
jgi:hypothetical protein